MSKLVQFSEQGSGGIHIYIYILEYSSSCFYQGNQLPGLVLMADLPLNIVRVKNNLKYNIILKVLCRVFNTTCLERIKENFLLKEV